MPIQDDDMLVIFMKDGERGGGANGNTIIQPDFSATPNLAPHTTHPPYAALEVPQSTTIPRHTRIPPMDQN